MIGKTIVWFVIKLYGLIRNLCGLERNCMVSNHESYGLGRVWGRSVWVGSDQSRGILSPFMGIACLL